MARLAGLELQDNWRVAYALTRIKGIGWSRSAEIMHGLKLKDSMRVSDLDSSDISKLTSELEKHKTEGDLARSLREDIQRLRDTGSYRGMRHARGLPARGQRTKSNARTKRGKRKTVGAFKKDDLAKQQESKK